MTILEALTAVVQVPGINTVSLEKACIDADLNVGATYTKDKEKTIDSAAVNVLKAVIIASESEGGFSYSISKEALEQRILRLEAKWDATISTRPTVTAVDKW